MWNIDSTLTEGAKYCYPRVWQREMWQNIYYTSSNIFTTRPFESKIFASPTLCVHPYYLWIHPPSFCHCLSAVLRSVCLHFVTPISPSHEIREFIFPPSSVGIVWWYNKDNLCTPVSPTLGCYCWLNNSDASAAPSVYFDWVWPQHGNLMTGIKRNLNKYLLVLSLRLLAATKPPSVDNKHRHSAGAGSGHHG